VRMIVKMDELSHEKVIPKNRACQVRSMAAEIQEARGNTFEQLLQQPRWTARADVNEDFVPGDPVCCVETGSYLLTQVHSQELHLGHLFNRVPHSFSSEAGVLHTTIGHVVHPVC
jgi:hypothetical protein